MLSEYLNEKTIRTNIAASDWKEAIQQAGQILVDEGIAENTYIEAMIENGEVNGGYFVLVPGVAVPHAKSEAGVNKVGMSLMTLKEPINFITSPNNPVKLVICLAATDNNTHIDALKLLADFLGDEDSVCQVMQAKERKEVINVLNKYN